MVKAVWHDMVIADSEATVVVEGNHYFPPDAVKMNLLHPTDTKYTCPWKGDAKYYSIETDGATNKDAAWTYPDPKPAAAEIKDRIAFWKGVTVS